MISLRPYQERAVADVLACTERRVLLVLPTGGGKTVLAAALFAHWLAQGKRMVFLAHRREIIKQSFAKLVRGGIAPDHIGVLMSGVQRATVRNPPPPESLDDAQLWDIYARRLPHAPVQVGSIDTFRNRVRPKADIVLVDEAHRALAKSYVDVQRAYPDALHIGLTATPYRADNKPLSDAYDKMIVAATYLDLVDVGALVVPECYGSKTKADLSQVRRSGGDYRSEDLAKAVDKGELVGDIVDHWQRRGNNAPTFCFAINVAHSKHLAQRFVDAGIPALHVDGNTETGERDRALAALRSGEVKVLCNCNVFTEGTDVPAVKTIILARPTLSEALYRQEAGRGSRPYGDTPFVVLDHAGCCTRFGLPHEHVELSLEGRPKKDKEKLPPAKDCPKCYAIVPRATRVCPGCGHTWTAAEVDEITVPKESAGELVLLTPFQSARLKEWVDLVLEWRTRNAELRDRGQRLHSGGWCTSEWRNRTGSKWPPKGSKLPKLSDEEQTYNLSLGRSKPSPATRVGALVEWTL